MTLDPPECWNYSFVPMVYVVKGMEPRMEPRALCSQATFYQESYILSLMV